MYFVPLLAFIYGLYSHSPFTVKLMYKWWSLRNLREVKTDETNRVKNIIIALYLNDLVVIYVFRLIYSCILYFANFRCKAVLGQHLGNPSTYKTNNDNDDKHRWHFDKDENATLSHDTYHILLFPAMALSKLNPLVAEEIMAGNRDNTLLKLCRNYP